MCGFSPRFSWMTSTPGSLPFAVRRTGKVGAHRAVPGGRGDLDPLGDDARVVGSQDQRVDEVGGELVEQHRGGDAADRELRGPLEELPAIDVAVDVGIEQRQQLLVVVVRGLARFVVIDAPPGAEHTRRAHGTSRGAPGPDHAPGGEDGFERRRADPSVAESAWEVRRCGRASVRTERRTTRSRRFALQAERTWRGNVPARRRRSGSSRDAEGRGSTARRATSRTCRRSRSRRRRSSGSSRRSRTRRR